MKLSVVYISLALATVAFVAPSVATAEQNTAVVNVARIFEEYQMTRDLESRFEEKRRTLSEEAEQRRGRIEQMRRGLAAFDPESEDFAKREMDLMREEAEFQVWSSYEDKKIKGEHKSWLLQIYRDTQNKVAEVAKERNIDLVLTYDPLSGDAPDSATLRQEILLQKVIYHSERVDLTGEVLDRLNKSYAKNGGSRSLSDKPAKPKDEDNKEGK